MSTTYQPPRYIRSTEQAKMIRAALKAEFPGVTFSVRCSRGSAIDIRWVDGPTSGEVDQVAQLYKGGGFDGMQDLRYSVQTVLSTDEGAELVQFSADFVFSHRTISDEWTEGIFRLFSEMVGRDLSGPGVWLERVPLFVERSSGRLYRMVDTDLHDIREVFHQFTGARQGGSLDASAAAL